MALFYKLSLLLLLSFVHLSMESVLKKDTESLPDVIAEADPEGKSNLLGWVILVLFTILRST